MNRPLDIKVYGLWLAPIVATDPLHLNPSIRAEAMRGGGVPTEPIMIVMEEGIVIWEPSGEVRTSIPIRKAPRPIEGKRP